MPRYFLHLRDGDKLLRDEDGSELPDLEAARAEALKVAREILSDAISQTYIAIEIWTDREALDLVELRLADEHCSHTVH